MGGVQSDGSYKDRGMTVAVVEGGRGRRRGDHLRLDRKHLGLRRGVCRSGGFPGGRPLPGRCSRRPEGCAEVGRFGAAMLEVRGSFDEALAAARELAARGRMCSSTPSIRTVARAEDRRLRDRRGARLRAGRARRSVGGGGNTSAYRQALTESGLEVPIVSVEAADRRHTLATAIRIGEPGACRSGVDERGADRHRGR